MTITMQKAVDVAIGYLTQEATKIPSMQSRFLVFAALGAARANSGSLVAPYMEALRMVGVVTPEGTVDTVAVRSALETAFANVPQFTALGFTFTQADASELVSRMEA